MNEAAVRTGIGAFAKRHKVTLARFGARQSQLLEVAGLFTAAQHYRAADYRVAARNLQSGLFRAKVTTSRYPAALLLFEATRPRRSLRSTATCRCPAPIRGAMLRLSSTWLCSRVGRSPTWAKVCSQTTGLADLRGVEEPGHLSDVARTVHWYSARDLAVFLSGRVPYGFRKAGHFVPALITVNHMKPSSKEIVQSFASRGYRVQVVPGLDGYVARHGWSKSTSPLASSRP
jgi:hypothetical protein